MSENSTIRTVQVTRYIAPLREGGSLPGLAEADDDFKYVIKFKGAGHGVKALISELLGGEIARVAGLKVPEIVFATVDECFGRTEGDEEIQDLLRGSEGMNLGLHFLSGALTYDPVAVPVNERLASQVVWLDAFITNIDRTFRNTNMLVWHNELWLIDHGASFFFHHSWDNWEQHSKSPFVYIKDHVLLPQASLLDQIDQEMKMLFTEETIKQITDLIPEEWLQWDDVDASAEEIRNVYFQFLLNRINHTDLFINEANHARKARL